MQIMTRATDGGLEFQLAMPKTIRNKQRASKKNTDAANFVDDIEEDKKDIEETTV